MHAPPRPNTPKAVKPAPRRAPGHRDDVWCNGGCEVCDERMTRRARRYERQVVSELIRNQGG